MVTIVGTGVRSVTVHRRHCGMITVASKSGNGVC